MRIIISPAKKMNTDTDTLEVLGLPRFLARAEYLTAVLRGMSHQALKSLWRCSDAIAELNIQRLERMDLRCSLTPALLAYEGIQYRHMAPGVFTWEEFSYLQEHLRILSGLYGILRPFDGVVPYRLEMQAKLSGPGFSSLYQFWGTSLADTLAAETGLILNLASREYSRAVSDHLPDGVRLLTCTFGELENGRIVEKGTLCKMARGELVRWMAERRLQDTEELKAFHRLDYRYAPAHSSADRLVFLREKRSATRASL